MSQTTYEEFLMKVCRLDYPIKIRILEVNIRKNEIKFIVQFPNSPVEKLMTQSISGLMITNTHGNSSDPTGLFKVSSSYKAESIDYDVNKPGEVNWRELYSVTSMDKLLVSEQDYNRYFPKL